MPWDSLSRLAYAVCVSAYEPLEPTDLPLQIGDELYVMEVGGARGEWYRGYLMAQPSILAGLTSHPGQVLEKRVFTGIFPKDCVEIREYLDELQPEEQGDGGAATVQDLQHHERSKIPRKPVPAKLKESSSDVASAGDESSQHSSTSETENSEPQAASGQSELEQRPIQAVNHSKGHKRETPQRRSKNSTSAARNGESRRRQEEDNSDEARSPDSALLEANGPLGTETSADQHIRPDTQRSRRKSRRRPPAPVPMLKVSDESPTARDEPLLDEIASALREWYTSRLSQMLLDQEYRPLQQLSAIVNRLDYARGLFLRKRLTAIELDRLREQVIWDLSKANKLLTGSVIVRSKQHRGRILTAEDSPIDISKLQATMSLLDEQPSSSNDTKSLYHVFLDLKSLTLGTEHPVYLECALYSKRRGQTPALLTECFHAEVKNTHNRPVINFNGVHRTLFTDILSSDLGEGKNDQANVYLALKMITNEPPFRRRSPSTTPPASRNGTMNSVPRNLNSAIRTGSVRGPAGLRQSGLWGRKSRNPSTSTSLESIPQRSNTTVSQSVPEIDKAKNNGEESLKEEKPLKRISGFAVLNISKKIQNLRDNEIKAEIRPLPRIFEDGSFGSDDEREIASEALGSVADIQTSLTKGSKLVLSLRAFQRSSATELMQQTPTLFYNVNASQRLGFAGAPQEPRSDIYITLRRPNISSNALLLHPRDGNQPVPSDVGLANLIVTLEVRDSDGNRIDNAIWPASSRGGHGAWRTYALEAGTSWNQTIRLKVDADTVPGTHLVMSMAEGIHFPFALCWMPLWSEGAFVRDGEHSLALHKYDDVTSALRGGKGAYMSLPWQARPKDESVTGRLASLQLETFLCSTSYSQDSDLLGLLHWKDHPFPEVLKLLKQFPFVPEIETVKLLKEVFNSLFGIVVEYSGNDDVEDLVFNCLITVLGIVNDRRFNLQPIVDEYVQNEFMFPFAFPCLLRSFDRLLDNPTDPQNSRRLRAALKVGAYILKFMIRARQQQVQKEVDIGINSHRPTFAKDLKLVFSGIERLMRDSAAVLIGTKTLIVQNFHTFLPELRGVMNSEEILTTATNFINCLADAEGKLVIYKILLVQHISDADLFPSEATRDEWVANVGEWLAPHWGSTHEPSAQWRDQVRLCCSVVATLFDNYGSRTAMWVRKLITSYKVVQTIPKSSPQMFSPLFPTSYPFPTRPVRSEEKFDEALIEIAALLAASSTLSASEYPKRSLDVLTQGLKDTLDVAKSILDFDAFPATWLSVHVLHHRSCFRFLQSLFEVLVTKFLPQPDDEGAEDFNYGLWKKYLSLLIQLVSSNAIALETFPEQRRRAVWKIAGDIRESGADLLQRSWHALGWECDSQQESKYGLERLGGYQLSLLRGFLKSVIALCLNVHDNLRHVAIHILYSMIVVEWDDAGSLETIQTDMIKAIHRLYKAQTLKGSATQTIFTTELLSRFDSPVRERDTHLYRAVSNLLEKISELLNIVVVVTASEGTSDVDTISDSVELLNYYTAMDEINLYIAEAHHLSDVHLKAGNHVEAALALRLHSDLLEWNSHIMLAKHDALAMGEETEFERKENLMSRQIDVLEQGGHHVESLRLYEELAQAHERHGKRGDRYRRILLARASLEKMILERFDNHAHRDFFLVYFQGQGWDENYRDKYFVYEVKRDPGQDKIKELISQQFPDARFIKSEYEGDIEGQHVLLQRVQPILQKQFEPVRDSNTTLPTGFDDIQVPLAPGDWRTEVRPNSFRLRAGKKDTAQDRLVYSTQESFPTLERRSMVVRAEMTEFPRWYLGIEIAQSATAELYKRLESAKVGDKHGIDGAVNMMKTVLDPDSTFYKSSKAVLEQGNLAADSSQLVAPKPPSSDPRARLRAKLLKEIKVEDQEAPETRNARYNKAMTAYESLPREQQALHEALIALVKAIRTGIRRLRERDGYHSVAVDLKRQLCESFPELLQYLNDIEGGDQEDSTGGSSTNSSEPPKKAPTPAPKIDVTRAQEHAPDSGSIQATPSGVEPESPSPSAMSEESSQKQRSGAGLAARLSRMSLLGSGSRKGKE